MICMNDITLAKLGMPEAVQQILLPEYTRPDILVAVEHSAQDDSTEITFSYCGEKFDIRDTDNKLSLSIIFKHSLDSIRNVHDVGIWDIINF